MISLPLLAVLASVVLAGPLRTQQGETPPEPTGEIRLPDGGRRLRLPAAANAADAGGLRLLLEGSYDEAIKAFDRSLRVTRKNPRALANRGVALSQLGRLDEALVDFEAALALAPELRDVLKARIVDIRVRRGRGLLSGGEVAAALKDFYDAIRIDCKDPRGYAAVASAGRRTHRSETCVSYATKALELGSELADTLADRAACLLALGRKEEARVDLDRAILLEPDRGELFATRAAVALELGRRSDARRDARRALELDPLLADQLPPALR